MARKSKIETETQADSKGQEPTARHPDGSTGTQPKGIVAAAKPRPKKTTLKKKNPRAIKPADPKKASRGTTVSEPSDEEIGIRAYFIAERRIQLSLQGDSAHDWIEAKQQLLEEANRKVS